MFSPYEENSVYQKIQIQTPITLDMKNYIFFETNKKNVIPQNPRLAKDAPSEPISDMLTLLS